VDEDPLWLREMQGILEPLGHPTRICPGLPAVCGALEQLDVEVAVVGLPPGRDLEVLGEVKCRRPEVLVVVMSETVSIEGAVACMRGGAFDYLGKASRDPERVRGCVASAMEERRRQRCNEVPRPAASPVGERFGLVGASRAMQRLLRTIESLADNESHVLLQGESGTGKELVARAIHGLSGRRAARFAPVDCGALPEGIVESELFGHERGAFTGALGAPGLLRGAHGGTLFLDEVGELPLAAQAKLLRALQEKQVRPLGAARSQDVDARVIAATHRDLEAMVADGSFRADLFYRLDVVRIEIPPLRERREDVPLLVEHFLAKHAGRGAPGRGIQAQALEMLVESNWPGNVRELENVIESAVALAPGREIRIADLPRTRRACVPRPGPEAIPLSLAAYERCALERALVEARGDASEAARRLGVARSTLYRKLSRHGLGTRTERGEVLEPRDSG